VWLDGLRDAVTWEKDVASVGIDSWAVDYALLRGGRTLGEPFHYRDARNEPAVERVHAKVAFHDLYARNGLQFLPFNTVYQLFAEDPGLLAAADRLLLVPDLLAYWLTGSSVAERTNASTSLLLDPRSGGWAWEVIDALGLPRRMFGEIVAPGTVLGPIRDEVAGEIVRADCPVGATASHDWNHFHELMQQG